MRIRCLFPLCLLALHGAGAWAADAAKPAAPPEPPKPLVTVPVGLIAGRTNLLSLRGLRVKDATNVVLDGWSRPILASIGKREDAKLPEGLSATRAGDQSLEVEVLVPEDAAGSTNLVWSVRGTNGVGTLSGIPVVAAAEWVEARESNGGFADAQPLKLGQTVRGTLEKGGDVDVFRVEASAGTTLHAEVFASRVGSTLDAILTVYDEHGTLLVSNDDAVDQDPIVEHRVGASGPLFVVVTYANEKAAKTHGYLLQVKASK
jgi:hypothetical protein